jgi:poly-gamma-glutamate capsule biosynthesis protein CapA/YwtB (metallophosphatase superfamily)
MKRRGFLRSSGAALLGLLGQGVVPEFAAGARDEAGTRESVTLFLGGDVMTGRGIDQVLPHPGDPVLYESYVKSALEYVRLAEAANGPIPRPVGFDYIWGDALVALDRVRPDARIVNLETAVTTSDEPWPGKGIHYRMHPRNIGCLTAAGIDCCALANNHVLDWHRPGLEETLTTLQSAGMRAAGAGMNLKQARDPAIVPLVHGRRLLVYSIAARNSGIGVNWAATPYQSGVNGIIEIWEPMTRYASERIRTQKMPGDIVVVSVHWGGNWGYRVPGEQRDFAARLIEAGADVVHGHSSHHAKGIEVIGGRPVIYGCGDLINDYEGISDANDRYRGELPLLYFVTLDAVTGALQRLEMQPMRIRNFRLTHASAEEAHWLQKTLHRQGQAFNTSVTLGDDRRLSLAWTAGQEA